MFRTGGKDHRTGLQFLVARIDAFVIASFFHTVYRSLQELRSQFLCMMPERHSHIESTDAGKSQIVIHLIGIEDLTAAHGLFFYNK